MSTNDLKQQICDALAAWIRQRPGLEFANYSTSNYAESLRSYRAEQRSIARDKRDAETLLQAVRWRDSITADMLQEAFKHSFSGRLTCKVMRIRDKGYSAEFGPYGVHIDYCTGQYWPTEYRKAAAAVLAGALWYAAREHELPSAVIEDGDKTYPHANGAKNNISAGEWLRSHFRREFGSKIQRRWFN